jgi:hypothetical protein
LPGFVTSGRETWRKLKNHTFGQYTWKLGLADNQSKNGRWDYEDESRGMQGVQ